MQGNTAVQLRAARIGGEYQRTAIKVDQELGFGGMVCARPVWQVKSQFYKLIQSEDLQKIPVLCIGLQPGLKSHSICNKLYILHSIIHHAL